MKKIIAIILCAGFVAGILAVSFSPIAFGEGSGTANVINASPTAGTQEIYDSGWVMQTSVVPNVMFYYNVTVTDVDGSGDILNTTITLNHLGKTFDDPKFNYVFCYNETDPAYQWAQIIPTAADAYIIPGSCSRQVNAPNDIVYSFAITMNKTAQDSNGVNEWRFLTTSKDSAFASFTSPVAFFGMGAYVELTYWGNAGGMDFTWTGGAESNQSAAFNTLVTSNDNYDLNASFTDVFNGAWGAPTMWIKSSSTTAVLIPDASGGTGANVTWHTVVGPIYSNNVTHSIALEFPPGLPQATYTGVTIWIMANNG